jgi:prepilin-type N-terminal cleavage/methylation domain-containing protein
MILFSNFRPRRAAGFTLMELLVVIAIILVLAVITLPVLTVVQQRAGKVKATNVMRQLGTAVGSFAAQNDNTLPGEGTVSSNSWAYAADPANANCWFNALPRILGLKGAGDYATNAAAFYTKDNLLYLPGAIYPTTNVKLVKPLFAIGINSKLQRRSAEGTKGSVHINNITSPARTVLFLERGLPSEKKAMVTIPHYDGAPKASPNSFVARYSGVGVLTFVDGHAEAVEATDILNTVGKVPFPPTDVIWCRTPDEDPNLPSQL